MYRNRSNRWSWQRLWAKPIGWYKTARRTARCVELAPSLAAGVWLKEYLYRIAYEGFVADPSRDGFWQPPELAKVSGEGGEGGDPAVRLQLPAPQHSVEGQSGYRVAHGAA